MKNINYKIILKIVVSLLLMAFLANKLDLEKLSLLSVASLGYLFIGCIITLVALFIMTLRWKVLCKLLNVNPSLLKLYSYYLIGMFYNIFLPGAIGGDIVRTRKLTINNNVSVKEATSLTVVERICGLYMLFILTLLGILFLDLPKGLILKVNKNLLYGLFSLSVMLIPLVKQLLNKKINIKYNSILPILLLSFIAQLGDIIIAYLFSCHLGIKINFTQLLIIMPIVYFATVLPISLGGLGVREGTFVAILSLYNIETSTAILISFLMYLVKVIVGLVGWGISMMSSNK